MAALPLLAAVGPAARAASTIDLPGACASGSARTLHEASGPRGGGVDADNFVVRVSGLPISPADFNAGHLHIASRGRAEDTRPAALAQAATAASAALLTALAGRQPAGCDPQALRAVAAPLQAGLSHGASYDFTWSEISIHTGTTRTGARHLSLHLDGGPATGSGGDAHLTLSVDGAVSNDQAGALLPHTAEMRLSLAAASLPALLAMAPGSPPLPVRIDGITARRDETSLSGHGDARVSPDPAQAQGTATVDVSGYDALIAAAEGAGLQKARTALFLAKLVAHRKGDALSWDLDWHDGLLSVNKVPLPLR
ncbi:hypothetical protein [Rhizosaccharibacter radicis]|uniref:DUF2125 domain-containing protein n=1 Tax=Rhizosaccharibacter radicis TaxID=2782605 RepID=A0ABT1VYM0_9PROT|nr:DUF2125 domain-containing protein [Acetobacteraceae bacterium KSS12]